MRRVSTAVDSPSQSTKHEPLIQPIFAQEHVRPKAQSLEHARTERIDDDVRVRDDALEQVMACGTLDVEHNGPLVAHERVGGRGPGAVDADDVGAPVGEDESCERARREPGELRAGWNQPSACSSGRA